MSRVLVTDGSRVLVAGATGPLGEARSRGRRTLAIVALVASGLELLLGPLNAIVFAPVLRTGGSPSVLSLLSGVVGVVSVVLAIVAMALAVVSIVRGEQARVLAGIALGIGIAALVGVLATLLQVGLLGGI